MKTIDLYFLDDEPAKIAGFKKLIDLSNARGDKKLYFKNGFGDDIECASTNASILQNKIETSDAKTSLWIVDINFELPENLATAKQLEESTEAGLSELEKKIPDIHRSFWKPEEIYLFRVVADRLLRRGIPLVISSKLGGGIPSMVADRLATRTITIIDRAKEDAELLYALEQIEKYVEANLIPSDLLDDYLENTIDNERNHLDQHEPDFQILNPVAALLNRSSAEELLREIGCLSDTGYQRPNLIEEANKAVSDRELSLGGVLIICWAAYLHKLNALGIPADEDLFLNLVKSVGRQSLFSSHGKAGKWQEFARAKHLNGSQSGKAFKKLIRQLYLTMTRLFVHEKKGTKTLLNVVVAPELNVLSLYLDIPNDLIAALNSHVYDIDKAFSDGLSVSHQHQTSAAIVRFYNKLNYSDIPVSDRFPKGGYTQFGGNGNFCILQEDKDAPLQFKFSIS